jgi:PIN domain nuclease of toxin-antitoxin system
LVNLGRIENDPRWFTPPPGIALLPILPAHCLEFCRLPRVSSHKDPFDRMLIAQASVEDLALLTRDSDILDYGDAGAQIARL